MAKELGYASAGANILQSQAMPEQVLVGSDPKC